MRIQDTKFEKSDISNRILSSEFDSEEMSIEKNAFELLDKHPKAESEILLQIQCACLVTIDSYVLFLASKNCIFLFEVDFFFCVEWSFVPFAAIFSFVLRRIDTNDNRPHKIHNPQTSA